MRVMFRRRFSIGSLLVATMLVAILLPAAIAYYPAVDEYFSGEIVPQTVEEDTATKIDTRHFFWCPAD